MTETLPPAMPVGVVPAYTTFRAASKARAVTGPGRAIVVSIVRSASSTSTSAAPWIATNSLPDLGSNTMSDGLPGTATVRSTAGACARPSTSAIRQSAVSETNTWPVPGSSARASGDWPTATRVSTWMADGSRGRPSITDRVPAVEFVTKTRPRGSVESMTTPPGLGIAFAVPPTRSTIAGSVLAAVGA